MNRIFAAFFFCLITVIPAMAQPPSSKEQQDLEKQRQQLKKELEQAQTLLDNNKRTTKENISTLVIINHKLNKQENVIENISREINLMDNTIYKSQRDVNKLHLLLDTLKQEYAKSMVYSYKNRSNSDFLNFIFSSSSFNDAVKRITYLKSYRNYRAMQEDNILHTQALLKNRIDELSNNKEKKNVVLQVQSKEVDALQTQQEEKNKIVAKLKAQGKELNNQIAAKKKQMSKVNNALTAAIKRAIKQANDEANRARKAEANIAGAASSSSRNTKIKKVTKEAVKPAESVLLASPEAVTLNAGFERNRGNLPWPVSSGYPLLHFGPNKIENIIIESSGISIGCEIGLPVKVIFDGEVQLVNNYDDVQMVVIKHGRYFTTYSNINNVSVSKGQEVKVGQVIGKAAANLDGVGAVDLHITKENTDLNPEIWLKRR